VRGLFNELRMFLPLRADTDPQQWANLSPDEIEAQLVELAETAYASLNRDIGHQLFRQAVQENVSLSGLGESADPARRNIYQRLVESWGAEPDAEKLPEPLQQLPDDMKAEIESAFVAAYWLFRDRQLMLSAVDSLWVRHLTDLEILREGIGLRAYGQQNPLVAYRKEAHEMYSALLARIQETVARSAFLLPQFMVDSGRRPARGARAPLIAGRAAERLPAAAAGGRLAAGKQQPAGDQRGAGNQQGAGSQPAAANRLPGRNDPCWCGSGKKYKACHMRQDMESQHSASTSSAVGARAPQAAGPSRKRRRAR